ncbi:MAG: hypothetical protein QOH28_1428 [Actinomycetota bacterium]|jgi:hypothetical protein|nr:hypothetical protein [Actinomycetota bacterium]
MRPGSKLALAGAVTNLAVAAGLGAIRATHSSVGLRHVEGQLPTLAIVITVAAPGVLSLIGVAIDRPVLFGAAGIACLPLTIVSIAAVPIFLPAVFFLLAFARATSTQRSLSLLGGLVLIGFQAPILVGLWVLITQTREFTYRFGGGSEGGEYFTPAHAGFCIAIVAVDLVIASALARLSPAPRREAPGRSDSS